MLIGPLVLIVGAVLLLRGTSLRLGTILTGFDCIILMGFAFYNSIVGMHRRSLEAPPPYLFYIVLLLIMILSDVAVYRVYKAWAESDDFPQCRRYQYCCNLLYPTQLRLKSRG